MSKKELRWKPRGPDEIALVLPNDQYPELKKVKRLIVGPGQRAVLFMEGVPRPKVLAEGAHEMPKKVRAVVLVNTGPKEGPYGLPIGTVYESLGFSGKLILTIQDGDEDVENFVNKIVLGQGITDLGGLVKWLVDNYLVNAFKDAVCSRALTEEEFLRGGREQLIEDVKERVNSYIMEYGLYLENISIPWWARRQEARSRGSKAPSHPQ